MTAVIGIFKGGGAKGSLYVGALQAARERGLTFAQVAGTSAGAITAAFVAAGATPEQLRAYGDEAAELGLAALPPPFRGARRLRNDLGILPLDDLAAWLAERLTNLYRAHLGGDGAAESGPTFQQLAEAGAVPLHVVAADLVWKAPVVFNAKLTPHLAVAHAAAASSAIPFVYESPLLLDPGAPDRPLNGFPVADGGVLANVPLFIFTDPGYAELTRVPIQPEQPPVVAFTLVSEYSPFPGEEAEKAHDAYRRRYRDRTNVVTWSTLRAEIEQIVGEPADTREAAPCAEAPPPAPERSSPSRGVQAVPRLLGGGVELLVRVLDVVLRGVELVVLPPVNTILRWASRDAGPVERGAGPRARRWQTFAERAFNVAPGHVVVASVLLAFVLAFGLPTVVDHLWPDWGSLLEGQNLYTRLFVTILIVFLLLFAAIGFVLVGVVLLLGLLGYAVGWAVLPAAKEVGIRVISTFMRSPQEPLWAGLAPNVTIVRIDVPKGWTALKTTRDSKELDHVVACVRRSVHEQLDQARVGRRLATRRRTGAG